MVIVWVAGIGRQVGVARFQAHETNIDPKLISEDEKYMFEKDYTKDMLTYDGTISKDVREQLKQHGYPAPEVYDEYREKYNWKPKVILPEGSKITSLYIKMCNGEIEDPFDRAIEQKSRAIPFVFEIFWTMGSGKKEQEFVSRIAFTSDTEYWAKSHQNNGEDEIPVDFNKNEIRTIFKDYIEKNKDTEIIIKLDPLKENSRDWSVNMYLQQSGKKYIINEISHDSGKYD